MLSDASHSIPAFVAVRLFTACVLAAISFGLYVFLVYRRTVSPARLRQRLGSRLDRFSRVPAELLDTRLVAADEDVRFGWWGFACAFGWGLLCSLSTDFSRLLSAWFSGWPSFATYVLGCLPVVAYILAVVRLHDWLVLRRLHRPDLRPSLPA